MEKINFEDGQLIKEAFVKIDEKEYPITEAEWGGKTPLSAFNLNKMQENIEKEFNKNLENTENAIIGQRYYFPVTQKITSDTEFEIPCNYKVGSDELIIIYCGEILIKAVSGEKDGHYYEVGEKGTTSNKIKLNGWDAEVGEDDDFEYFEFIIRGNIEDAT